MCTIESVVIYKRILSFKRQVDSPSSPTPLFLKFCVRLSLKKGLVPNSKIAKLLSTGVEIIKLNAEWLN